MHSIFIKRCLLSRTLKEKKKCDKENISSCIYWSWRQKANLVLYMFFFLMQIYIMNRVSVMWFCPAAKKLPRRFNVYGPWRNLQEHTVLFTPALQILTVLFLNTNWIKIMWRTSTVQLTGFIYGIILWFFFVCFRSPDLSLHLLSKIPLLSGYSLLQGPLSVRAGITN